jgi:REP element-mobilizing transposase RayT
LVAEYRRRVAASPVEARPKEIIGAVVAGCGGEVIVVEGTPDHVHLRFVENQKRAA